MPREFGKLWFALFADEHFCAQPVLDKLLFTVLLGQPAFNYAGWSPIQLRKWAKACQPATNSEIKAALIRLERNRYVYTDSDTEEILIRSFIRNDRVEKQPNLLISALGSAAVVESPKLAAVLLAELDRLTVPETSNSKVADRIDVAMVNARKRLEARAHGLTEPFAEPFGEDFPEGLPRPAETQPAPEGLAEPPVVVAVAVVPSPSEVESSKDQRTSSAKPPKDEPRREDVETLCTHLRDLIIANDNRAPGITAKWRTEARLLLDKDGIELTKALALIDWCQDNEFWKGNILSMPKFREKYDTLRNQANKEHRNRSSPAPPGSSRGDQKVQGWLEAGGFTPMNSISKEITS